MRILKTAAFDQATALYHGTPSSFDKLKPNALGIIWLTPDMSVAKEYASPHFMKSKPDHKPVVWKVLLKPNAKVCDLKNVADPTIKLLKDEFNKIRAVTYGSTISDQDWPSWADFGLLEVSNGSWTRWLKSKRVDAVTCGDYVMTSARPHESIAVLRPAAIQLQEITNAPEPVTQPIP